ncbi:hypothetical protein LguiA_032101 [Lonicera macranthoides]
MAYLLDDKNGTLRRSAIIVNAQDGLTLVLAFVLNYFAYASAIGGAGRHPLKVFLFNQLRRNISNESLDNIIDEKRVEATTYIWWQIPRFVGTLTATFVLAKLDWKHNFLISAIVLGCALLFFLSGYKYYHWENPKSAPNSLVLIFRTIKAAINKRKLPYSDKPEDYFKNDDINDQIPLTPDVLFLRWLDKAAIIERTSSLSAEEQENQGTLCTVAQVKEVKFLLRMLPLWAIFMQYSILKATGNTFFYEQSDKLDYSIGDNFKVPTISLYLTQSFSNFAISSVCNLIIFSKWFNVDENKNYYLVATKVRIGIGLACSCLCCFVARLVEIKRLQKIHNGDYFCDREGNRVYNMSVLWLVPQFCLLGLGAGLIEDGVDEFFYCQTETLKDYKLLSYTQNLLSSKITEEQEEDGEEEAPCTINTQAQRDKIRGIIEYQKSLYFSSSSSSSSSSSASCSSFSSSRKSANLLELMKEGSTSLRRLFDMEHTSLATHWKDYSGSPIIKPILLWGSDEEGRVYDDPWIGIKNIGVGVGLDSQSGGGQSGLTSKEGFDDGEFEKSRMGKHRMARTKSFRRLPRFRNRRFRGFRLRLRKFRIMICGRKF